MTVAATLFLALFATSGGDGPLESRAIARNSTAEVLVEKSVLLGIEFDRTRKNTPRASDEDTRALSQAGVGAWLEGQLQVPDESIENAPAALRRYLDERREALAEIVTALERQPPEWGRVEPNPDGTLPFPELLPSIRLQKVLLAAALLALRDGSEDEAGRLLEASWSLGRPAADSPMLLGQMVSIAGWRWQAGLLRKMQEPSLQWMDRLGSSDSWRGMLDGIAGESALFAERSDASASDPFSELSRKAPKATADVLRRLSPCEAARLEEKEAFRLVEREMMLTSQGSGAEIREIYRDIWIPQILSAVRRSAWLSMDRELTLTILQLKLDRRGDPEEKWPSKLANPVSAVCPDATYEYWSDGSGMEIRLIVEIPASNAPFTLPLAFRVADQSSATAATPPPAALTPTPTPHTLPPQ
jgi:hypothetical protein